MKKISKKQAIAAAGAVVVVAAVGGAVYASSGPNLELKQKSVNVEYGTQYEPQLKDLVKDYKDFDKKSLKLVNKIPNEKDKTYPAVGKYTITVKYNKKSVKQTVVVKDTKAPSVVLPQDIQILQGSDLGSFDFKSLMSIEDASDTDVSVDTSKVDVNTPADYEYTATVADKYGNKTEKKGKITVQAKPEIGEDEEVVQESIKNADGTTTVRNSVQKRSETSGKKVVSNSSNVTRRTTSSGSSSTSGSSSSSNRAQSSGKTSSGSSSGKNSSSGNSTNKSSGSSGSSSGNNGQPKGTYTGKYNPDWHYEDKNRTIDGGEISGDDFDKLTGGDWKDWN